jgi:hypothetical protein
MGVYNPNMEMPRNCTECIEFKDDCNHYWDYYCTHESRPNDCPLIEIDELKVGKWINDAGSQKCSICDMSFPDLYPLYDKAKYCPNCGAEMGEKVARPTAISSTEVPLKPTATSSTEVPWWIEGE